MEFENPAATQATVLDYAYPMAVNLVVSLQNNDYLNFSKDFDPGFASSFPRSNLTDLYQKVSTQFGRYINLEYENISTENDRIVMIFLCNFQKGSLSLILKLDPTPPYRITEFSFPELK